MTLASVLLTLALLACAAMLCIGGQLIKWSSRRTPFSRGAFFLAIVIGILAVMIPGAARSELQARSLAASSEEILPPVVSIQARLLPVPLEEAAKEPLSGEDGALPAVEYQVPPVPTLPMEMEGDDAHHLDATLSVVGATDEPKWSLIVERAERLRSQGDYVQAVDMYAEVLVSAGGHLGARLGLAQALLESGRHREAELHVGRASAIARQDVGSPPDLASAFSAVEEIRKEFARRLSGPLTTVQRQRLNASEQARLTAIWEGSPWRITINVTDVREVVGELVVEGTLTTDPALSMRVHSGDRSHVQRSIGEQLAMTIVLTRWPSGPEAFDAREVPQGRESSLLLARARDILLGDVPQRTGATGALPANTMSGQGTAGRTAPDFIGSQRDATPSKSGRPH